MDDLDLNDRTNIALLQQDIGYIKEKVASIDLKLEKDYVTREEFEPIKRIVYGMVGIIMTSVLLAIILLVIRGIH